MIRRKLDDEGVARGRRESGGLLESGAPRVAQRSADGSGDSMVAGLAIALSEGSGLVEGRLCSAAGAGTATTRAANLCRLSDSEALLPGVKIHQVEGTAAAGAEKPRLWPR